MPETAVTPHPLERPSLAGAALLTVSGVATAFGLASCCALPISLAALGFGTAWLGGIGIVAAPHRLFLMIASALLLTGGGLLLWRQRRAAKACGCDRTRTPRAFRVLTFVGLVVGAALLWGGYTYA